MGINNLAVFNRGMKKAQEAISGAFDDKFEALAKKLFDNLCQSKDFLGFTGNTQRSYTVAYFLDGDLRYLVQGKDRWSANEIRKKVRLGEKAYIAEPYEGKARRIEGKAEVDDYYAWQTALNFVMSNNDLRKGYQIIAGVGTEYYSFITEYSDMEEQISYYLTQDRLWEHLLKQVKGQVALQLR